VARLRPKLQELKEGAGSGVVDWDSRREERRRYIERGARRVVGKGGGGGEEVGGERRGKEEVEGLEGVVREMERGEGMEE